MTQTSRPEPSQPKHQTIDTTLTLTLESKYYLNQFDDGGELSTLSVAAIVDRTGQTIAAVWEPDWTEIAPGIRTKHETIEIQATACPVVISFIQERNGTRIDRRYNEHRHSATDRFQIRYEQA